MKKVTLFTLVSLSLFFGCKEEEGILERSKPKPILSEVEIEKIGNDHNSIVSDVILSGRQYSSLESILRDAQARVPEENFASLDNENAKIFLGGRPDKVLIKAKGRESYTFVKKMMMIDFNGLSFDEVNNKLIRIEQEAKNTISDPNELTAVLVAASVAKKSAQLWMPASQGGLDLMSKVRKHEKLAFTELRDDEYGPLFEDEDPEARMTKLKAIIASDFVGGYFGFLQTAVFVAVPGANAIVAGSVVLQASQASILAAISYSA